MLENKKNVFWQAFFVAFLVFLIGILMGVYLEQMRIDESSIVFYKSDVALYDSFALSKILDNPNISCQELTQAHIDFANNVYEEAKIIEKFDDSNKVTESIKIVHRKYDLLRTLLWIDIDNLSNRCNDVNYIVYLYSYNTDDLSTKSEQIVWSRVLSDLKEERGDSVILIPIAADQNISSLDYLMKKYNIEHLPALVINGEEVAYKISSQEEIEKYLN